jgi:tetratricopeptide (TPR) repeat protein
MTKETRRDPRAGFVPRILPWVLGILMLGVYGFTLNRWLSFFNMEFVVRVSGWRWQPEITNPLIFLATYPLRWLPAAMVPVALNFFAAVCGALTLGLLARTVALLPQDRTEAQRSREHSDFSFLTIKFAWLPPLFAVLVCGLQFTFWENATNFTGEVFDLLVFAFTVWSLVEYRLDERAGRLLVAAFVYGADMSENFAMIGFLPLLLAALIWVRGLSFFNLHFLTRLFLCGVAGTSLYFLLPTTAVLLGHQPGSAWWPMIKASLFPQLHVFKHFFDNGGARDNFYLITLTTLLPVLLMSLRWAPASGDGSKLGTALTGLMIHAMYAVMLGICVWGAFDPPFSARHLGAGMGYLGSDIGFLSFYYLAALSVGYFTGYFLLISKPVSGRSSRRRNSPASKSLNPLVVTAVIIFVGVSAAGLVCKNAPAIATINSGILKKYASLITASLPHTGGILLSDSENTGDAPRRLYLVQEELLQEGREKEYVPVDTQALNWPDYQRYLHRKYPQKWPLVVDAKTEGQLNPRGLLGLITLLSRTNDIYYLHPSFGYYFEVFYQEPHGMIYQLKRLPDDTLQPPLPDARLIAENEAFWTRAENEAFGPIFQDLTAKESFERSRDSAHKVWKKLHVQPEPNLNAQWAGTYYSQDLDFWGVEVQRAQDLPRAAAHFETALKLNPDNTVAAINLDFNRALQAGQQVPVDLSRTTPDHYGKFRSWGELLKANGPLDEPSFCFLDGNIYLQEGFLNQAIASYARVRKLDPNYLPALLALGEVYAFAHRPALALKVLQPPLAHPGNFSLNAMNSTELDVIAAAAFIQNTNLASGVRLLEKEVSNHPDDDNLLMGAAQVYMSHGLLTNALHVIKIKLAASPDDPNWLFRLGYIQMRLRDYPQAIAALTKVITLNPDNNDALFNRAVALLSTGQLHGARADYEQLQKVYPKSFRVAYGLGEIAWRQRATNDAVHAYTVYLANAPTNTVEFKLVSGRLADLKGRPN